MSTFVVVPRTLRNLTRESSMSHIPSIWIWLGIVACITLSALFAGLNLAIFSLSQLRLQIEADGGNKDAARVLDLRKNSNQVLATVIWGNVGTNVFLTLLSDSVLAGLAAFFFSAVVITLFGEIAPQAYFSRNALRMTARFLPFLIFWRAALFFLARPTAMLLDWWLGVEGIAYLRERDVRSLVARCCQRRRHREAGSDRSAELSRPRRFAGYRRGRARARAKRH